MTLASDSEGPTTVLLFGPQALSFSEESLQRLRSALSDNSDNAWMGEAVAELPECTRRISEQFPKLKTTPAATLQESLTAWLAPAAEAAPALPKSLPNAVLTPLVVLDQLAQYTQYVQLANVETGMGPDLYRPQPRHIRTIGFCTGLLSALAVSSASTQADFRKYAAVAVRLAALIGALVDAEEAIGQHGSSKVFSIAWHSTKKETDLRHILQDFPGVSRNPAKVRSCLFGRFDIDLTTAQAYISVLYDENRATITTSEKTSQQLEERFRAAGITAQAIGLRGRFHYPDYLEDVQTLLSLCDLTPELQLPDAADAVIPIHSMSGEGIITQGKLHHIALRGMLIEQSHWGKAFDSMSRASLTHKQSLLVSFGSEKCVPPTAMPRVAGQTVYMATPDEAAPRLSALKLLTSSYSDNDIAVVGMACKVAGADDVDEFWHLNCRGESQHREVPPERFTFETHWRAVDPQRKWFGNFVRDHDAFDHK